MSAQHLHTAGTTQPPTQSKISAATQWFGDFLLAQWATMAMLLLGFLVLSAIAVPFLSYFGFDALSKSIFFSLHYVCAQIPSHSFYILGHQLGLCARNFSIYTSMFLTSVVFVISKKRLPGIPWWVWILMILPMALDGTTQIVRLARKHLAITHDYGHFVWRWEHLVRHALYAENH